MGEHDVKELDSESLRAFTRKLLGDLQALDLMLQHGAIETGVRRIGAEQELFLVDRGFSPAPIAMEMLEKIDDEHYTTELARFNLEFNTDPLLFGGDCLQRMEKQLVDLLAKGRKAAHELGADVIMTGILQTLDISDLSLENMTPKPRYLALNEAMRRLRGSAYEFYIKGADELIIRHENVMVEACNTSFQAHFQVGPEEFATLYNLTQAVAGPVLAAACNSPLLFGRRLWRETRIALFQQSVDHRAAGLHLREQPSRVSFGRRWVDDSVLEIFREDITRFKVLLSADIDEDSLAMLRRNEVPESEGAAAAQRHDLPLDAPLLRHLRRAAPICGSRTGSCRPVRASSTRSPTPLSGSGLLSGLSRVYPDIRKVMEFDTANENFVAAARLGLRAQFGWPGHQHIPADELILEELLPVARDGLKLKGIDPADVDRYLGIVEERVRTKKTGAQWQLDSFAALRGRGNRGERLGAITGAIIENQKTGLPVHQWPLASLEHAGGWEKHFGQIEQFMTTDIITTHADEAVELVANLMQWKKIRHVPVEDNEHRLIGIVSASSLRTPARRAHHRSSARARSRCARSCRPRSSRSRRRPRRSTPLP